MKVYALLFYNPGNFNNQIETYKRFKKISRCILWVEPTSNIKKTSIIKLRKETQCEELIIATSLFRGDCEHPGKLDEMLPKGIVETLMRSLEVCQEYIDGVMFGNAGCEIGAKGITKYKPNDMTAYIIKILKVCRNYAKESGKTQWAGIMDGEIVIDSYNYRKSPSNSPLLNFLIRNNVPNVIFCGYQLCYPVWDHRRTIIPEALYTVWDAYGSYPYNYFRRYIRKAKMLSGAGHCYGIVHGSLQALKETGYCGAVVGLNTYGLKDIPWRNIVAKVNKEVSIVQSE